MQQMSVEEQLEAMARVCPCCGVDPKAEEFKITCNNMDLAELGAGYVIYFKMIIVFGGIALGVAILNVFKLVNNLQGSRCVSGGQLQADADSRVYVGLGYPPCEFDWISAHSVANFGIDRVDDSEKSVTLVCCVAYWLVLAFVKNWIKRVNKEIDRMNDTPSDWTLMVAGTDAGDRHPQ